MTKKAVILLSGGLDSATALAIAGNNGFECHCLSFNYRQRHDVELKAARKIADSMQANSHRIFEIDLSQIGGSALTDRKINVPEVRTGGIPVTYVPARNTIFLAIALGYAETLDAFDIFIGVNAIDYSGYPDCRPEFIQAFGKVANLGTRAGVSGEQINLQSPLINLSKPEIIKTGHELGVDYSLTISCYQPDTEGRACGMCDSCYFRKQGFASAGMSDPTRYYSQ